MTVTNHFGMDVKNVFAKLTANVGVYYVSHDCDENMKIECYEKTYERQVSDLQFLFRVK